MDKKNISLGKPELVELKENKEILVTPFLSLQTQITLAKNYLENYFYENKIMGMGTDVIMAEHGLMFGIFDKCTNAEISTLDIDEILANYQVWEEITEVIKNYWDFRSILGELVRCVQSDMSRKASVGTIIDSLASRVEEFFANIQNFELSPETASSIKSLLGEVENSPVLSKLASGFSDSPSFPKKKGSKKSKKVN